MRTSLNRRWTGPLLAISAVAALTVTASSALAAAPKPPADPALTWTVEALIPATATSLDPDAPPRALSDRASAGAEADRLRAKGYPARVEAVAQPPVADVRAGTLGYRVRVGSYPTKLAAAEVKARMAASGEPGNSVLRTADRVRATPI